MRSEFNQGPFAPCPTPFNMAAHVLRHAYTLASKPALEVLSADTAEVWTYADLEAAVRGTGTGLLRSGLQQGDIVLMRLANTVEFPIAYLGALAVGLVPVPTSTQLSEPEVAAMIAELEPAAVLHDASVACPKTHLPVIDTAQLNVMHALPPADFAMGDPDRLGYIIYTSGTSGKPRAVMHAHRAVWARQMMVDGWYGLRDTDRLLHAGAFNWTYTLGTGLMDPWAAGATALIPAPGTPPADLPALLATHEATLFAAAPGVYRKMLADAPDIHLPQLRHGFSAGEKLSDSLRSAWHAASDTRVFEAFGMSECSTFISACPSELANPGTLGRPQTGRRIALLEDGAPVALGAEGTIAVHRSDPGLMLGYFNAPTATAERFQGDWFLTGDRGVMDTAGHITYAGRADDMMNAGGYRVSPIEVETALAAFPGLTAVGVTDVEIKRDARIIAAFYTADHDLEEGALKAFAARHLAGYKQPRLFRRLDALPTNANGKLSRKRLRETFKASS